MSELDGPVEHLSEEECWGLLATQPLGRIATSVRDVLDIFPINYLVDDASIVFRTSPGDKLAELTINENVAFEVDSFTDTVAWSVIVKGAARVLEKETEVLDAEMLPMHPWIPTPRTVYVRVFPKSVTGRRFARGTHLDE